LSSYSLSSSSNRFGSTAKNFVWALCEFFKLTIFLQFHTKCSRYSSFKLAKMMFNNVHLVLWLSPWSATTWIFFKCRIMYVPASTVNWAKALPWENTIHETLNWKTIWCDGPWARCYCGPLLGILEKFKNNKKKVLEQQRIILEMLRVETYSNACVMKYCTMYSYIYNCCETTSDDNIFICITVLQKILIFLVFFVTE